MSSCQLTTSRLLRKFFLSVSYICRLFYVARNECSLKITVKCRKFCHTPVLNNSLGRKSKPSSGACFIHQVYRLVRKESVRDISYRQIYSRFYCLITYLYSVMLLIARSQSLKYINSLIPCRFFDIHRLKSSLKSCIFLNVFSVLSYCCGTYHLYLTA